MREKQRYLLYRWKNTPKMSLDEFETLLKKEINRQLGDFGLAMCGPRFRLFEIAREGFVVKLRIEAHVEVRHILATFKSLVLVHVSGSASLAKKAIARKFPSVKSNEVNLW